MMQLRKQLKLQQAETSCHLSLCLRPVTLFFFLFFFLVLGGVGKVSYIHCLMRCENRAFVPKNLLISTDSDPMEKTFF